MLADLRRNIDGRRRVYLVRHGAVRYLDEENRPYPLDDLPLSDEGIAQAEELARALEPVRLDRLVASGLRRTLETAAFFARGRDIEVEVRTGLREIAPGSFAEIPEADRERALIRTLTGSVERDDRFLGGETFGALEDRALPAFREILAAPGWKDILIVAHGGTNRVLLAHVLGSGLGGIGRIEQDPASLNIIDVNTDGTFIVRLVNYSAYSPLKERLRLTTMEGIYMALLAPEGPER